MSDLPNLQDIKHDLADRKARGWSVQHGEALVAALEAVIEDANDPVSEAATNGQISFGIRSQAKHTLDLINQHLTIGETK